MNMYDMPADVVAELEQQPFALLKLRLEDGDVGHALVSSLPQFVMKLHRNPDAPKASKARERKDRIAHLSRGVAAYTIEDDTVKMSGYLNALAELTGWMRIEIDLLDPAAPKVKRSTLTIRQMADVVADSAAARGEAPEGGLITAEYRPAVNPKVQ
jgi:hypothetical protein